MPTMEADLINVDTGAYDLSRHTCPGTTVDTAGSVQLFRLQGGLSDGVDVVRIDNGRMRLDVLPTRGMGIWQAEIDGVRLGWDAPVERPVHPSFVDPMRRGGIGWLDGFNELICRCGLSWHGAPVTDTQYDESGQVVSEQFLPLHGRIANLPAHLVSLKMHDDLMQLTGVVDEASLFGGKLRLKSQLQTRVGSSSFRITDTVTNAAGTPAEVQMLYHCNLGRPLLSAEAQFVIAHKTVAPRDARAAEGVQQWPHFSGPEAGYAEQVYFIEPILDSDGLASAVLTAADQRHALALRFDGQTLPWCVLWKNTQAEEDGYVAGIEPASSFPNGRQFEREQGRVIILPPGESVTFRLELEYVSDEDACGLLLEAVSRLQSQQSPDMQLAPHPEWSPA
jgi:galactose mutarotase-like enzyme